MQIVCLESIIWDEVKKVLVINFVHIRFFTDCKLDRDQIVKFLQL